MVSAHASPTGNKHKTAASNTESRIQPF